MAFIAPVVAAIGIGTTIYGMSESAKASRKAATAERVAAGDEADQLEARAKDTLATGTFVSEQIKAKAEKILSSQRAQLAAGGDTTTGTAAEFRAEGLKNLSIDQLLTMAEASSDAAKDRKQATVTRETGRRMSDVRRSEAMATLISGTANVAGQSASWLEKYGG